MFVNIFPLNRAKCLKIWEIEKKSGDLEPVLKFRLLTPQAVDLRSPKLKNDGPYLFLAERKSFSTVNTLVVSPGAQRRHVIM